MDMDIPLRVLVVVGFEGTIVPKDVVVVAALASPSMKYSLKFWKGNKPSPALSLQQKPFKKEPMDKPSRSHWKTYQEKVNTIGETLIEFRSIRSIDSIFPNLINNCCLIEFEGLNNIPRQMVVLDLIISYSLDTIFL